MSRWAGSGAKGSICLHGVGYCQERMETLKVGGAMDMVMILIGHGDKPTSTEEGFQVKFLYCYCCCYCCQFLLLTRFGLAGRFSTVIEGKMRALIALVLL